MKPIDLNSAVALALTALLAACASPDPLPIDCGSADRVTLGDRQFCVYRSAIIETGFNCPPEAQFAFPSESPDGEEVIICSPEEEVPDEVIEEAAAADPDADPNGNLPQQAPAPPSTPAQPCADDEDGDGVCADVDCDDRDATIWENCPAPPVCTDDDNDGVCVEDGDCDDSDSEIKPGILDYCDGIDNNCDGQIDEEGCAQTCGPEACTTGDDCAAGQACREVPDGCSYCF